MTPAAILALVSGAQMITQHHGRGRLYAVQVAREIPGPFVTVQAADWRNAFPEWPGDRDAVARLPQNNPAVPSDARRGRTVGVGGV